ncbi:HK97 family phage prohead protease [Arcanobacterium haemolyticum]
MIRIIIGPPAAGKSTYVAHNAAAGDVTVDFDRLAMTLGSRESHDCPPAIRKVTKSARQAAIDTILDGIEADSWIIHSSPSDSQMKRYKEAGAEIITIDPGKDEALRQAEKDDRPAWTAKAIEEWYSENERSRRMKIEQRSATIEASNLEERTLTARAVPYGESTNLFGDLWERFEPGALQESSLGVKLRLEHAETIGVITAFENRADGAYITAKISDTVAGRDAYTLLKDGALKSVSIGFRSDPDSMQIIESKDRTDIVHHRAELLEVSLVSFPAYENAAVTNFRSLHEPVKEKEIPMHNEELTEIRSMLEDHSRRFDAITDRLAESHAEDSNPLVKYRSLGEYVKAVVGQDETALRDYEGATTTNLGDTMRPAWIERTLSQMIEKQRLTNLFNHTFDLPSKGMSLEFPVFGEDSLAVEKQEEEGKDLPFGKITLTTGTAPINTYGGASRASRQLIERSTSTYLDVLFQRMALHYARSIEMGTRTLFNASVTSQKAKKSINIEHSDVTQTTVNDWIKAIIGAAEYYDDTDFPLTGLIVNSETFLKLATLNEQPKALKFSGSPDDKQGEISVKTLSGSISSLSVIQAPITNEAVFYSKSAIEIKESPGAPFRLQDENIINLSKDFAVYGYAAHFAPDLSALLPVKIEA